MNATANLWVSVLALLANIAAIGYIAYRAHKLQVNPYTHEVFTGTRDFEKANARVDEFDREAIIAVK